MTAELSDISVGTVEGKEGWNTVIVRTPKGEDLLTRAKKAGVIEIRPLTKNNLSHLKERRSSRRGGLWTPFMKRRA